MKPYRELGPDMSFNKGYEAGIKDWDDGFDKGYEAGYKKALADNRARERKYILDNLKEFIDNLPQL